jgi:hypothetical protein
VNEGGFGVDTKVLKYLVNEIKIIKEAIEQFRDIVIGIILLFYCLIYDFF